MIYKGTMLRERFSSHLILRGLAENTLTAYIRSNTRLAGHYNTPSNLLTNEQIQSYLLHLSPHPLGS